MTRSCGSCSLCCKLPSIEAVGKPAGQWCRHCTKPGCGIYTTRPITCQNFNCEWLRNDLVPSFFYPRTSHIVVLIDPDDHAIVVVCDPIYIRKPLDLDYRIRQWIEQQSKTRKVRIAIAPKS